MPRRNKRSLKAINFAAYWKRQKGFGSSSSSYDLASAVSEEDFDDLISNDDDFFFDKENQSSDCDEDDERNFTEYYVTVTNFWTRDHILLNMLGYGTRPCIWINNTASQSALHNAKNNALCYGLLLTTCMYTLKKSINYCSVLSL